MTLDRTINRCPQCNRVARWKERDGDKWWCKDHAPYGSVWVPTPVPPPPPELEGELIGKTRLQIRVKR